MITAIATILALALLVTALRLAGYSNRCANLEYLLHMEREITTELATQLQQRQERGMCAELAAQLQDATRTAAYWQQRHDALLAENSTLSVDLASTEREAQYLRGYVRKQNDVTAGVVLLYGAPQVRQLHAASGEQMP